MEAGQIVEVVGYDSLYDGKRGVIKFVNHCYTDKERSMVTIVMSDGREYCFGNHFLKLVSEQLKL